MINSTLILQVGHHFVIILITTGPKLHQVQDSNSSDFDLFCFTYPLMLFWSLKISDFQLLNRFFNGVLYQVSVFSDAKFIYFILHLWTDSPYLRHSIWKIAYLPLNLHLHQTQAHHLSRYLVYLQASLSLSEKERNQQSYRHSGIFRPKKNMFVSGNKVLKSFIGR